MRKYVDDFIDFGPGIGGFPSNIHIDYYKPLKQQVNILREDMFWFGYGDDTLNYVIDVGWYGKSFSLNGFFRVNLIKNGDWFSPLIRVKCKSIKRLVPAIQLCLSRLKLETNDFESLSITA